MFYIMVVTMTLLYTFVKANQIMHQKLVNFTSIK